MITTAHRLEGIGEYYFSHKLREVAKLNQEGRSIINLGIGSPDLPPHPSVIGTLQQAAADPHNHAYQGYKGVPALRNAFASWYKKWYAVSLDPETEILPLIGSKEGIMHVCMTYLQPGDEVLVPNPGYPTYSSAARLAGAETVHYELTAASRWQPDFNALQQLLRQHGKIKLMFVNYPHMPTGQRPDPELFERIVSFAAEHGILVCHDNPYSFILNDSPMSLLAVEGAKEVVIELNSLSKSHNMAGWRVGVLCGAAARIAEVLRFKSNMDSGMFLPLQLAAAKALELGADWHKELNLVYSQRKKIALELLHSLGCTTEENQAGMFVWAAVPDRYTDGYALSDELLYQANVFLTPGGIFGSAGDRYIRISLCCKENSIGEAIERIKRAGL